MPHLRRGYDAVASGAVHDNFFADDGIHCLAPDVSERGYSRFLMEMKDLGSGTARNTELIHGDYLENHEFHLMRESCRIWRDPHQRRTRPRPGNVGGECLRRFDEGRSSLSWVAEKIHGSGAPGRVSSSTRPARKRSVFS
jgi:hypothetical protein